MRLLVTGGCGFIGSNFVHMMVTEQRAEIVNLDALTYAGNLENLSDVEEEAGYTFVKGDIGDREVVADILRTGMDGIVNFAAESHVDRSIMGAGDFVRTNVAGTLNLLERAREAGVPRFLQVSTDEVYGSLRPDAPAFTETSPLEPNSPYSASKASADLLCRAFWKTHGLPVVVTRCSNNYGPYQFPEKLIPLMIVNALHDRKLPVYGDGMQIRDWIHTRDHCEALWAVFEKGGDGEIYNIGGNNQQVNIDIVKMILKQLDKPEELIEHVQDRPGHDRRYAIDNAKVTRETGWKPQVAFDAGLAATVDWYLQNRKWWEKIQTGAYLDYYAKQYGGSEE